MLQFQQVEMREHKNKKGKLQSEDVGKYMVCSENTKQYNLTGVTLL